MISIIIPMYNSERTIERALNSVLNQTYKEQYEIIIINDGSTDSSLEIVENYRKNLSEKNIEIIIVNKKNGGVATARNAGLKVAKGEYIALLDSDDEWLKNKIEIQLRYFQKEDIELLGTTLNGIKYKRFFFKKFDYLTNITLINLMFKNFFQPSTVVFKKNILEEIGAFPNDQRYAEEGNFFMKIAKRGKAYLINEPLLNFGDMKPGFGHSGLSGNIEKMQEGEIRNFKFAMEKLEISKFIFVIAYIYSYIKYIRRKLIVKFREE